MYYLKHIACELEHVARIHYDKYLITWRGMGKAGLQGVFRVSLKISSKQVAHTQVGGMSIHGNTHYFDGTVM